MAPPGLFGSFSPPAYSSSPFTILGPSARLFRSDLHLAPSTAMPHPSPAQHKQKHTSHATVWSITHHTKGANLPWFLNLPLDECIDQHTLTNSILNNVGLSTRKHSENVSAPQDRGKRLDTAETQSQAESAKLKCAKQAQKLKHNSKCQMQQKTSRTPPEPQNSPLKAEIKAESSGQADNQISPLKRQKSANSP